MDRFSGSEMRKKGGKNKKKKKKGNQTSENDKMTNFASIETGR